MGKIVGKKKKGRPSLLDLHKRSLKLQQQQQQQQLRNTSHKIRNPSSTTTNNNNNKFRRSTRRNPNSNSDDDEDNSDDVRREKKVKLVVKLPDDEEEANCVSDSNPNQEGSNSRKRKIGAIVAGSGLNNDDKDEKHNAAANQSGCKFDDGPSTPLPDKKLLLFILDRLQKKDTYGVYSDPVDPEELPDYFEVIKNPMDFATVRKKLGDGAYANLEQFEKDVLLICSNAMQYNAPDTIFFRQARSMQEMAKKDFENLRQDSDDDEPRPGPESEPEPKVARRGRPPTKNLKRPPGRPPLEHANPHSSEAKHATNEGNNIHSNNDVKKGSPLKEKLGSSESFARSLYSSRYGEPFMGGSAERYDTGSGSKGISFKHGKKSIVLDENKRNTYKQTSGSTCRQESSILATFDAERKLLIPVGLHTEYGYARSLSRFAGKLGPVAWKVASKKIAKCLPADVKFGPGWVGENETFPEKPIHQQIPTTIGQPSPPASLSLHGESSSARMLGAVESRSDTSAQKKPKEEQLSEAPTSPCQSNLGDGSTNTTVRSIPCNGAKSKLNEKEASASCHQNTAFSARNSDISAMKTRIAGQIHQNSHNQSRMNGLNGSYGLNFAAQMGKMIGPVRPNVSATQSNSSIITVSRAKSQNLDPSSVHKKGCGEANIPESSSTVKPPDLNVGFPLPGSPSSGRADSVQPDLALQL